ncbi:hypothetical protein EsH8_IX_000005 [Colletotrichum jinshuiense]
MSIEQFYAFNPSVKSDCSDISITATGTGAAPTGTGVATPMPIQTGMVPNCNTFKNIALDDFYSWNPAVKADCTGLQADVYVGVGVSAASETTAQPTTTTASSSSPKTPTPTQEGMFGGCGNF